MTTRQRNRGDKLWQVSGYTKGGRYVSLQVAASSKARALAQARAASNQITDKAERVVKFTATARNPGFFSKSAEAGARRVKRVHLVKEIYTGEIGELLTQKPALLKDGWVKVKWRNRDKPTLIQKSEITAVTAAAAAKAKNPVGRAETERKARLKVINEETRATLNDPFYRKQPELRKAHLSYLNQKRKELMKRARKNPSQGGAGAGATSSDVRSPTRTEVRSPTKTSTVAHTRGNITVTGGAGAGATTSVRVIQRGRKKNPTVNALAETFQGRASGAAADFKAADSAPANLARIGKLVFLKLRDKRAQISAPGAMVAVDTRGRLWLVGRGNMFTPKAKAKGEALDYGEIDRICYLTAKQHIGNGKTTEYVHTFGEDGGKRPHLLVDHDGMPILRGGDYQIRAEGIVN